jgi:hypothetical protein
MKKIGLLVLTFALMFIVSTTAFALTETGSFKVTVNVGKYVELDVPEDFSLDVVVGTDTDTTSSPATVSIKSNCGVTVTAASTGYTNATALNNYISYQITYGTNTVTLGPNSSTTVISSNSYVSYDTEFVVYWDGTGFSRDGGWESIPAAGYSDTITFTVTY